MNSRKRNRDLRPVDAVELDSLVVSKKKSSTTLPSSSSFVRQHEPALRTLSKRSNAQEVVIYPHKKWKLTSVFNMLIQKRFQLAGCD